VRQAHEGAHGFIFKIDQREAIGQRYECIPTRRGRRCADHCIEADCTVHTVLEHVQLAAFDVHPQQASCRGIPTWPFRKLRAGVYGDLHGGRIAAT
jgi:hypothetical protein